MSSVSSIAVGLRSFASLHVITSHDSISINILSSIENEGHVLTYLGLRLKHITRF